jgi:zinc transport system substrate-binding protein
MVLKSLHKGLLLAATLLLLMMLTACGPKSSGSIVEGKVNVITTFYPIYEFASEIGGEDVNAINLLPVGVEPHDWTPRSQDIINTSKAQLFLYNGAGLEGWVPNFLKSLDSDSEAKAVEVSQGVELITTDGDDGHDHAGDGDTDSLHTDPHTWVSPKSALVMAKNIKDSLQSIDPGHTAGYEERYQKLVERLTALDSKFTAELGKLPNKEIVVSHQAFAYLARDYGLTQHAIMGLSLDAVPRGQDLLDLAALVKKDGIRYIFFEELVSDKLAKTLAGETGVSTMVLNPVEGLTETQEKNGDNYFTLMEKNLQNLILALQ